MKAIGDATWAKIGDQWGVRFKDLLSVGHSAQRINKKFSGLACWVTAKSGKKSKVILGAVAKVWDADLTFFVDEEATKRDRDSFFSQKASVQKALDNTMADARKRVPGIVKKAVKKRYPKEDSKAEELKPVWKQEGGGSGFGVVNLEKLKGMTWTYRGKLHPLRIAGVQKPFGITGPRGHRKSERASSEATKYGRGWVHGSKPWKIQSPKGLAEFGTDKRNLFGIPSEVQGIPLLFRRRGAKRTDIEILKTASIPQEVHQTESEWRPKVEERIQERLAHNLKRAGIGKKK